MKKILVLVLCASMLVFGLNVTALAAQTIINENFTYTPVAPVSEGALNSNWSVIAPSGSFLGNRLYAELTGEKLAVYGISTSYRAYLHRTNCVAYTGSYSGLGDSYMIKFSFDKNGDGMASVNDAKVGFGIRFADDTSSHSYYMLNFTGEGDLNANGTGKPAEKSIWTFLKVENASDVSAELRSDEVFETSTQTTGDGGVIMSGEVTIYVNGGSIYWTASGMRYGNIPYSTSGSYTDTNPLSGKTIGFTQSNTSSNFVYKGETTTNSKYTLVDDLTVEAYSATTVTIYDNAATFDDINGNLYGAQCEISDRAYWYLNENTTELTDGYKKIAGELYDVPIVRWGGGSTNSVNLMTNLTATLDERGDNGVSVGPVEFIKASLAINPDVKFIFNIGLNAQTPDETRQFTHFLLDETGEYADMRSSLGIENPVNLFAYELGNENYLANRDELTDVKDESGNIITDKSAERYAAAQAYCTLAKQHLDAVRQDFPRAEYPQVAFYPNVTNEPQDYNYVEWNGTVADMLGDYIDGVAYHFYVGGTTWYSPNIYLNLIRDDFISRGKPAPKFLFTEHAMWRNEQYEHSGVSLRGALCEATFFNVMLYRDDIASANYHNMCSSGDRQWNMFKRSGDTYYTTGINKVYKIYTELFGDKRINFGGSGVTGNTTKVIAASKRSSDGRIIVSVANADLNNDFDLSFNFASGKSYKITRMVRIASNSYFDVDYDIEDTPLNMPAETAYSFPKSSITFLTFEETEKSYAPDISIKAPEELLAEQETGTDTFVNFGEANGVIYAEMTPESVNGIYHYPRGTTVRKIVNEGNTAASVYVSKDSYAYKKLADIQPGGFFENRLSSDKYFYIKSNADIKIYSLIDDNFYMPGDDVNLSVGFGGNVLEADFTSADNNIAYAGEGKLVPLRNGSTAVTAVAGPRTVIRNVSVAVTSVKDFDFTAYGNVGNSSRPIKTPAGGAIRQTDITSGWKLVQGTGGAVTRNPQLYINRSGLLLTGASLASTDSRIASVMYYGDYAGIGEKYSISVSGKKSSVNTGIGLKFAVHNSGRNYYMLFLSNGAESEEGYIYSFYKFVNEAVTDIVRGAAEDIATYGNYGGRLSGDFTINVNVDGGSIDWSITGKRNGSSASENLTGSFIDNEPFTVHPSQTKIGIMANCKSSQLENYNTIKRIVLTGEAEKRFIKDSENNIYVDTRDLANGALVIKAKYNGNKLVSTNIFDYAAFSGGKSVRVSLEDDEKVYIWNALKPLCAAEKLSGSDS